MGILDRLFGKSAPALPSIPAETAFAIFTKRRRQLNIVGESHYQRDIVRGIGAGGADVHVDLVPEPKNPHDANAVAIHLLGAVVGYLTRANALRFHREMSGAGFEGRTITGINAGIYEWAGGYGLFLRMPSDIVIRMLEDEANAP